MRSLIIILMVFTAVSCGSAEGPRKTASHR
jgi:hypothetical protein